MTQNPPATLAGVLRPDLDARHVQALLAIFGERFVKTFQSPYVVQYDSVISCPVAQRFFRKDFSYLSKQLYIEYQYRSWRGFPQEFLDRYATIVSTKLSQMETLMKSWVARCNNLLETNGKKNDTLSLWPTKLTVDVPVIAANASRYVSMLLLMENVYALAATCNLYGLLDSKQRSDMEDTCRRALRAFRSVLENEVIKLYREAQRIQREQHGSPTENPAMAAVVEEQGKSIEEFARDTAGDNDGTGSNLSPEAASQLLDDATAQATALATRKSRPAKPKAEPAAPAVEPAASA